MPTPLGDFHQPFALLDKNGFKEKYKQAIEYARKGLPMKDTCIAVFGIHETHYYKWHKWVIEDLEDGFTDEDSNLIKLFLGMAKADAMLHLQLKEKGIDLAMEGNANMIQFLLKTQYGYSEVNKTELELSTEEETPIRFEIVDMKPNEEEE